MREKKARKCPKCGGEMEKGKECKGCGYMEPGKEMSEMSLRIKIGYVSLLAGSALVGVIWFFDWQPRDEVNLWGLLIPAIALILIPAIALIFTGLALAGKHLEREIAREKKR